MSLALAVVLACACVAQPTARPVGTTSNAEPRSPAGFWVDGFAAPGLPDIVRACTTQPNGDVVFGGQRFVLPRGLPADGVARWSGKAWSPLGQGTDQEVRALVTMPDGSVLAGGDFERAGTSVPGGTRASGVARWDGEKWHALGAGTDLAVNALLVLPNGDVIAGGFFNTAGGVPAAHVARWDGKAWSPLGKGVNLGVFALALMKNGDIVAAGADLPFANQKAVPYTVARWDGTTWTRLGKAEHDGNGVRALAVLPNGDLVAGGGINTMDGVAANLIARWDGKTWSPLGSGLQGRSGIVEAIIALPSGDLIVGGGFSKAGEVEVNRIARWDGKAWSSLGAGITSNNPPMGGVYALCLTPDGGVVVAGEFNKAGEREARRVAKWMPQGAVKQDAPK